MLRVLTNQNIDTTSLHSFIRYIILKIPSTKRYKCSFIRVIAVPATFRNHTEKVISNNPIP